MPDGQVLEFAGITKRFGQVVAVSDFSARIEPGIVTGFLGPNGAGKTTSLRMLLGLIRPTSGTATIGGKRYAQLKHPLQTVGAALEAASFHPGRSGAGHLLAYARAAGIAKKRVDEVLGLVGLSDAAGRKVGGYSLGMRQRLGLATALLGDPGVLVLDEPANGLDPEGIRWMRGFLGQLAAEGRTVLVSSHVLGEVQQTADALVIIAHGRRVFQGGMWELAADDEHAAIIDAPDRDALLSALTGAGIAFDVLRAGVTVRGGDPVRLGAVAASAGIALSNLHRRGPALEEVFLELVNGLRVHPSAQGAASAPVVEEQTAAEPTPAAEPDEREPEPESDVEESSVESAETTPEIIDAVPVIDDEPAPVTGTHFVVDTAGVTEVEDTSDDEAAGEGEVAPDDGEPPADDASASEEGEQR